MSWGVNFSRTDGNCTVRRADGSQSRDGHLHIRGEPTLQQPGRSLRYVFEYDLPPPILDQTVHRGFFFVLLNCDPDLDHTSSPSLQEIDGIPRHILQQEPGEEDGLAEAGETAGADATDHPPASARAAW